MADFMIRFLLCNVFLSGIIGILLAVRRLFQNTLSARMRYQLWFVLLALLTVPFLPFQLTGLSQLLFRFESLKHPSPFAAGAFPENAVGTASVETANWMNNFAASLGKGTPSVIGNLLFLLWIAGMLVMLLFLFRSALSLRTLKKSALPLQNPEVYRLYERCLQEAKLRKALPLYSTAYLKSPMMTGIFKPCIYLPIHLISDYEEASLRYILLHELQHYKHKDAVAGCFMNLASVVYWFHPLVWYALREMRNDRELACDTSVLEMLKEADYKNYGNTLISFAKKVSLSPFPFAAGLGGTMKQMKRRIENIAAYEKPTPKKRLKSMAVFVMIFTLLLGLAPMLSIYAADMNRYEWQNSSEKLSMTDLSSYFGEYEGSFVLYDLKNDAWDVYNMENASLRTAPNSTYKIYDALFALEEGVITPDASLIAWNGEAYAFDAWNADQTLKSAMQSSVNWYFQEIDRQLGNELVSDYIEKIQYGNQAMSNDLSAYWMDASLKISPIEQVELLRKLYQNDFGFAPENVAAVKEALLLSSSESGALYGKTGTGNVEGKDVNGWFVGYAETAENTWFFAANITADENAGGSTAAEITLNILSDYQGIRY